VILLGEKMIDKFRTGNVIRTKGGSIEIVTSVKSDGYTTTIFYDHENSEAGHRYETYTEEEYCDCNMLDCEFCNEDKPYIRTIYGMEDAELVANTVKDWITKSLFKNFEITK
jgi:uncharacterized protein YodC (DUF2158 family)